MFEFSISKQVLLTPLLTVANAVDKKQSLPILSNVLLKLTQDKLCLTATDLEIEITAQLPCSLNTVENAITVPAKKFVDIIRTLDDDAEPSFIFRENHLAIKVGRSQFKLATLPAKDYPNCEDEVSDVEFSLSREKFIHLLESTHFAMSQQDVRIFLNGLLIELDAQSIAAVATDGHRMAICRLPNESNQTFCRLLLPRKGIQDMLRLLNTIADEHVSISAGKNHFKLISSQYIFISKLIEARFPPYHKAIPKAQDKQVVLERDMLRRALTRISVLAHEKSRAILMHLQAGQLTLVANNQEQEEAVEVLEAQTEGEELKIGINVNYLLDVLNYLPDGPLRLSMSSSDSSILVESLKDAHYQYIIMPMKL